MFDGQIPVFDGQIPMFHSLNSHGFLAKSYRMGPPSDVNVGL